MPYIDKETYGPQPHMSAKQGIKPDLFPLNLVPMGLVHDHLIVPKEKTIVTIYGAARSDREIFGWAKQVEEAGYATVLISPLLMFPAWMFSRTERREAGPGRSPGNCS